MPGIHIKRASAADAERVGELFDLYRQFYQQPTDRAGAIDYLRLRLQRGDSVVLMAMAGEGELAGFCQLYPTFCSDDMARTQNLQPIGVSFTVDNRYDKRNRPRFRAKYHSLY